MEHFGFARRAVVASMENTNLAAYARSLLVEASNRTKEELLTDLNEAFDEIIRLKRQIAELKRNENQTASWQPLVR